MWTMNIFLFQNLLESGQRGIIPVMKPCGLNCPTCPYIEPGTVIQFSNTSKKMRLMELSNVRPEM